MRVVFMGTPVFAATILEVLAAHHQVVAVYTRPDAVRGRGRKCIPSPVKQMAQKLDITVHTPTSFKERGVVAQLAAYGCDVVCVAAFGMLLTHEVLSVAPGGCLNVHPSLLPRWRGAAPIERALLAGDKQLGVCVMRMEEGLDTGPYGEQHILIPAMQPLEELSDKLAYLGAQALLHTLTQLACGRCSWTAQDNTQATYAHKIEKGELNLNLHDSCTLALRKVQASSTTHPSRVILAGRPARILDLRACKDDKECAVCPDLARGEVLFSDHHLFLGFGDGVVEVLSVQPAGKQVMSGQAFGCGIQGIPKAHGKMSSWVDCSVS